MFELICVSYGIQYAIPVYLRPNTVTTVVGVVGVPWTDTEQSLVLTTVGLAAMIAAYYGFLATPLAQRLPRLDLQLSSQRLRQYIGVGLAIGTAAYLAEAARLGPSQTSGAAAFVNVVVDQGFVCFALLGYGIFGGELKSPRWRVLLYAAIVTFFLLGIATGFLEQSLVALAMLLVVYWHVRRRFPLRWFLAGLALFLVFNAAKNDYRAQVGSSSSQAGVTVRVRTWLSLAEQRAGEFIDLGPAAAVQDLAQQSTGRLDLLHLFAIVHQMSPAIVPYYSGATYSYLVSAWVPRFLWPDKPVALGSSGGASYDYGLQYRNNTQTSIGLGQPAEAYANFGPPGVAIIMAIQGLFFAVLSRMLNGPNSQGGRAVFLTTTVFFFNGIGTGTAILFGNVIQKVVADLAVLKVTAVWKTRSQRAVPAPPLTLRSGPATVRPRR
jgi:hypothetical protein